MTIELDVGVRLLEDAVERALERRGAVAHGDDDRDARRRASRAVVREHRGPRGPVGIHADARSIVADARRPAIMPLGGRGSHESRVLPSAGCEFPRPRRAGRSPSSVPGTSASSAPSASRRWATPSSSSRPIPTASRRSAGATCRSPSAASRTRSARRSRRAPDDPRARRRRRPAGIVLICVGTPIDDRGHADTAPSRRSWPSSPSGDPQPIVVVRSTLPVGTCERLLRDGASRDTPRFFTIPEFLRQGSALADFRRRTGSSSGARGRGPGRAGDARASCSRCSTPRSASSPSRRPS